MKFFAMWLALNAALVCFVLAWGAYQQHKYVKRWGERMSYQHPFHWLVDLLTDRLNHKTISSVRTWLQQRGQGLEHDKNFPGAWRRFMSDMLVMVDEKFDDRIKANTAVSAGFERALVAAQFQLEELYWDTYTLMPIAHQDKWRARLGLPSVPPLEEGQPVPIVNKEPPQ